MFHICGGGDAARAEEWEKQHLFPIRQCCHLRPCNLRSTRLEGAPRMSHAESAQAALELQRLCTGIHSADGHGGGSYAYEGPALTLCRSSRKGRKQERC